MRLRNQTPPLTTDRYQWLELPILALYAALAYKLVALGVLLTLVCSGAAFMLLRERPMPKSPAAVLAIAYAAIAMVTAFMVSPIAGVARTSQFSLILLSSLAIAMLLHGLSPAALARFAMRFVALNIAILIHTIVYHVMTHHLVTWKYLADTKFVFSAMVVITFLYEDRLRARSASFWYVTLIGLTMCILLSGERKAYVLLVAIFCLSRSPLLLKVTSFAVVGLAGLALVAAMPDSYVVRQLTSAAHSPKGVSNRYFFEIDSIGQHSDEVRTFVNRNADLMFRSHPWFGTGATGYSTWAQNKYGDLVASRGLSMNVHGERHRVPAENGLFGIAIVLAYLTAIISASVHFAWRRGGIAASSFARFPLYMTALFITYAYGEAMDTTMLLLILLTGFAAALPVPGGRRPASASAAESRPIAIRTSALTPL